MKLKKYAWIVALLAALSLAIFGCGGSSGDDDETGGGSYEELWNLADYLEDEGLEADDEITNATKALLGDALTLAGNPVITIKDFNGKLGFEVEIAAGEGWGAGFDFDDTKTAAYDSTQVVYFTLYLNTKAEGNATDAAD